jgi:hypothetical protein
MNRFWEYALMPDIWHEMRQDSDIDALRVELMCRPTPHAVEQEIAQLRIANAELRLHLAAVLRVLTAKGLATADDFRGALRAVAAEVRGLGAAAAPIEPPAEGDWRSAPPPPHRTDAS